MLFVVSVCSPLNMLRCLVEYDVLPYLEGMFAKSFNEMHLPADQAAKLGTVA